jgi:hypothetical protein
MSLLIFESDLIPSYQFVDVLTTAQRYAQSRWDDVMLLKHSLCLGPSSLPLYSLLVYRCSTRAYYCNGIDNFRARAGFDSQTGNYSEACAELFFHPIDKLQRGIDFYRAPKTYNAEHNIFPWIYDYNRVPIQGSTSTTFLLNPNPPSIVILSCLQTT